MLSIIHVEFDMITAEGNPENILRVIVFLFSLSIFLSRSFQIILSSKADSNIFTFLNISFNRNGCKSLFPKQLLLFFSSRQILLPPASHQGSPVGCHIY